MAVGITAIIFSSCGANKAIVQQPAYQQPQQMPQSSNSSAIDDEIAAKEKELRLKELEIEYKIREQQLNNQLTKVQKEGVSIGIPCLEFSMDDKDYFRDYGVGTGVNLQSARTAAMNAAKSMIRLHLAEFVQGLSTDYANTYAGQGADDATQRKMEGEMTAVVEMMLNNVERTCEEHKINDRGTNEYYIALQIPKAELMDRFVDVLSEEEKLGIDFRQSEFRKFADERQEKMMEAKKNAGY